MSIRAALIATLDSAAMARAYALTAFAVCFGGYLIEHTGGLATMVTMVAGLCVIGAAILWVRRAELSPLRIVPSTLLLFVGWAGVSLLLPGRVSTSLSSWIALVGFAFIAVVIAHTRDTLQTVRALGDTLRWLLALSLGVEILSGILIDVPFAFIGVQGNIALGGPIQGIFGTRNMLGLVAVLALITFVIEWRTSSIGRGVAIASLVLAGFLAAFSASPTVIVLAAAVGVASAALAIIRHSPPPRRRTAQFTLGAVVIAGMIAAFLARRPITALLGAGTDFSQRVDLWKSILGFVAQRPWQGYGWRGNWNPDDPLAFPYTAINASGHHHASALNAYFDVLLQLGAVGLVLFVLVGGTALVRSWFVASERRSVLYAWTPLMLVTLLVDSMFESFTLTGVMWMMLVLCVVRAGQSRSWRELLDGAISPGTPTPTG